MTLVTRVTEYPNGTKVTESFEANVSLTAPYDEAEDAKDNVNAEVEKEPFTVEFLYHGVLRTVANPQILRGRWDVFYRVYNPLLGGVELESGQYKNFNLSEIQPV